MAAHQRTHRRHHLVSLVVLITLLVPALPLGMASPREARAVATPQKIILVSEPGNSWDAVELGQAGIMFLTHGHSGCTTLNSGDYCATGSWPKISGAKWIWRSQLLSDEEATNGTPWLTVGQSFTIPQEATDISGSIRIAAADRYEVLLNGMPIGSGTEADTIDKFVLPVTADFNELAIRVKGDAMDGGAPDTNPAGIIYRIDITYYLPGNEPHFRIQPTFTSLSPTSATLYFESDSYARGFVDYGLTTNLGRVRPLTPPTEFSREHRVILDNLTPNTRYYFQGRVQNDWGYATSEKMWFRTPPADATAQLIVTTTNTSGSKVLPRACYDLFTDAGSGVLGSWVDGYCDLFDATPENGQVIFPALRAGNYVLLERMSPPGYALAPKRQLSITTGQTLNTTVTNVSGGSELTITTRTGAPTWLWDNCFSVYKMTDDVIGDLVSYACDGDLGLDGNTTMGNFRAGTYWVEQTVAPDGYVPFPGRKLTIATGGDRALMEMKIYPETAGDNLELQAIDSAGTLLPGACFILFDSADDSRAACDSSDGFNDGRTFFTNVRPGAYSAIEYRAPSGYVVGKRTTFTKVDNSFRRLRFTQVAGGVRATITTVVGSGSTPLPGACYAAYQQVSPTNWPLTTFTCDGSDGTNDGTTRLYGMKAGTYALVQFTTPSGYRQAADKTVTIGTRSVNVTVRTSAGSSAASVDVLPPEFIGPPKREPTPSPSATPSATATPTGTATPAPTEPPTQTPEPSPTGIPNATPIADAGSDQTLADTDGSGDETVTLDGSASLDPDGGELTYSWRIGEIEIGQGAGLTVALAVGTHLVELTVTDPLGATATDEVVITIESPPVSGEPTFEPSPTGVT